MSLPPGFIRVTHRRPCPVCGRPDWCLLADDGSKAVCARTLSSRPMGDAGYIHQLTETVDAPVRRPLRKPPPRAHPGQRQDWNAMARQLEESLDDETVLGAEQSLGVSAHSLWRLGMGLCRVRSALSFPMFDKPDHAVGIRLRTADGKKFAVSGSTNALFVPRQIKGDGFLLIVEGPTDTAAALDLGFDAIGRPSCSAAVAATVKVVEELGHRDIVVLANYDDAKVRPSGGVFFPGQEGAKKLAAELVALPGRSVRVVYPLKGKDVRQWKAAGATPGAVLGAIKNTRLCKGGDGARFPADRQRIGGEA